MSHGSTTLQIMNSLSSQLSPKSDAHYRVESDGIRSRDCPRKWVQIQRGLLCERNAEIRSDIEIFGSSCFSFCQHISSISFESNSPLKSIETRVFQGFCLFITVLSTILFISYDAVAAESIEIIIWMRSQIKFDFSRICRFGSGLPSSSDCLFDYLGLMEGCPLNESAFISTELIR
jgi:hypothetical protein